MIIFWDFHAYLRQERGKCSIQIFRSRVEHLEKYVYQVNSKHDLDVK